MWKSTQANRPRFFSDFWVIWVVLGDFRGDDGDLYEIWGLESIELVEFYLESRWNHLEWYTGESAQVFLKIRRFLDLFLQFFGVFGGKGWYFWNFFLAIDRARWALLGTSEIRVGTHIWTNKSWKKSNRAIRYPTYKQELSNWKSFFKENKPAQTKFFTFL